MPEEDYWNVCADIEVDEGYINPVTWREPIPEMPDTSSLPQDFIDSLRANITRQIRDCGEKEKKVKHRKVRCWE
ncbi:MAG: hypothetical protein DRJ15_17885 [Bacteroidetes bacterium]|nr:MAG: hypothetical protein DRJ15_17885 [Bacteroidota bacterium]